MLFLKREYTVINTVCLKKRWYDREDGAGEAANIDWE